MENEERREEERKVNLEKGERKEWKKNKIGKKIVVKEGIGIVKSEGGKIEKIRKGDVVWFEKGEKKWNGD